MTIRRTINITFKTISERAIATISCDVFLVVLHEICGFTEVVKCVIIHEIYRRDSYMGASKKDLGFVVMVKKFARNCKRIEQPQGLYQLEQIEKLLSP
uniref:Uncharacterized protein n=1 Tax=Romanomermis culicivorax TaxID=13658 RepID=A0A915KGY7_ROMCU